MSLMPLSVLDAIPKAEEHPGLCALLHARLPGRTTAGDEQVSVLDNAG
jgi:hypothetical protein